MAEFLNKIPTNLTEYPNSFKRQGAFPLEAYSVFYSKDDAEEYAAGGNGLAYVGQMLVVVNTTTSTDGEGNEVSVPSDVQAYMIADDAGTLKEVGTSPVGDEKTITVAEDGTVSLYGISGLELTRQDDEGNTTNITYQPLYVNGKLTWVEPSATTVEGLASEIEGLKTRISTLENTVGDSENGLVKDLADLNDKIGSVTEGKTVVEMISDAQTAATYDDAEVRGLISDNADAIAAIAEDYLKTEDKYDDSSLVSRISANEDAIEVINGDSDTDGSIDKKIKDAFNDFITKETADDVVNTYKELIDYARTHGAEAIDMAAAITVLESRVGNTAVSKQIEEAIEAENLDQYATDEELANVLERVSDLEAKSHDAHAHENKELLDTYTQTEENLADAVAKKHEHENASVLDAITADKVSAWDSAESNAKEHANGLNTAMDTRVKSLEDIGAEKNVVNSVDTEQFAIDGNRNLTLLDVAMDKVTGLNDALDSKVDKVDGYRLISADEATKLNKLVLNSDGTVEISAEVNAANVKELDTWITTNRDEVLGLLSSADAALLQNLKNVEAGAEVNDIIGITLGGSETQLTITDRVVDIPVADDKQLGVVLGSTAENKVAVAEDGTMEVNTINVNKLVQNANDVIVLNGGTSAIQ